MSIKKIRRNNSKQFLEDLKRVRDVMVVASCTDIFLKVTKKELLTEAETTRIEYFITDKIFKVKRDVMVIM